MTKQNININSKSKTITLSRPTQDELKIILNGANIERRNVSNFVFGTALEKANQLIKKKEKK